jgi:hypothetical protein
LNLKKAKGAKKRRRVKPEVVAQREDSASDSGSEDEDGNEKEAKPVQNGHAEPATEPAAEEIDRSIPCQRYNTMLAVQKNTLYLYGGILETKALEATLDDFYSIDLTKMKEWVCLRESNIIWAGDGDDEDEDGPSDDSDSSSSSSEDEDAYEVLEAPSTQTEASRTVVKDLQKKVEAFLAVSKETNASRSAEEELSTPKVGEVLRTFYERSRMLLCSVLGVAEAEKANIGHRRRTRRQRIVASSFTGMALLWRRSASVRCMAFSCC